MLLKVNENLVIDHPLVTGVEVEVINVGPTASVALKCRDRGWVPIISCAVTADNAELIADLGSAIAKFVVNVVFATACDGKPTLSLVATVDDFLKSKVLQRDYEAVELARVTAAQATANKLTGALRKTCTDA